VKGSGGRRPRSVASFLTTFPAVFPLIVTAAGIALIVVADALLLGFTALLAAILADIAGVLALVAAPGRLRRKRGRQQRDARQGE